MIKKNIALSVLVGVVLIACGGGGSTSGSSSSSGGTDMVASTTPIDKAINVDTATKVTATFSEDMLGTSIDNKSFTLSTANGATSASVSFDGNTKVASLTPTEPLGLLQTYSAKLDNTITNLLGDKSLETNWSFTTRDGSWGQVENLSTSFAAPAIDFDGNALAVWGSYPSVYASHYTAGTGWSTKVDIDTGVDSLMMDYQVVMNKNGNAVAVWRTKISTFVTVDINFYTAGTGWGTAQTIGSATALNDTIGSGGYTHVPKVVIGENGNIMVLWNHFDGSAYTIYAKRYVARSGWELTEILDTGVSATYRTIMDIVMDSNGDATAMWGINDGSSLVIYTSRYNSGAGWKTRTQFANGHDPDLAIDGSGNITAVWLGSPSTSLIAVNRYEVGKGWGTAQAIPSSGPIANYAEVAANSSGGVVVTWVLNGDIYSSFYDVNNGWAAPTSLKATSTNPTYPHISLDNNGNAISAWLGSTGGIVSIHSNRYVAGSGWGIASSRGLGVNATREPQVAIDSNKGYGIVSWPNSSGMSINHFE